MHIDPTLKGKCQLSHNPYGMEETTDGFGIPQIWETTIEVITWYTVSLALIRPLPEGGGLFSFVLVLLLLVLQHILGKHILWKQYIATKGGAVTFACKSS